VTQVCVISGAASGIGRATLEVFSSKGYSCLGIDKDREAIDRLLDYLPGEQGDRIRFVEADLVSDDEIPLGAALEALGGNRPELTLVNNVGGSSGTAEATSLDDPGNWDTFAEVLAFNLKPLHTLTQACVTVMKENEYGRIVNVSSVSARTPLATVDSAYAAAKAAVLGFTRHLALQLAEAGIVVNTICPGVIATDRIQRRWADRSDDVNREVLMGIPLKRLGRPEEVAEAIYFLGTATYATGSILDINGGMYIP
jgi:3-oxoacyl-[acyl-carrier protein] reductase